MRAAGQEIVGYYHSHPDHPARPSAFDTEHAWPWYSYLIVRIDHGRGADAGQLGAGRRAARDASRVTRRSQRGVTMSVTVSIPTPLRSFTGGRDAVDVAGGTVGEVLDELLTAHAGLKRHLVQDDGKLRNFVNLYLNDTDIRQLESTSTPVAAGDVLTIVPSIAGGSPATETALPKLSHAEILRYSRHLLLPEVGVEGQRKLKAARVLTIGAGGPGLAAVALPRGRRRGDDRHRGLRRRRPHQPAAADRARHLDARPPQARVGQGPAHRSQSERERESATRRGSPPRTRSTSSGTTTSSSTGPTTSRPATW